MVRERILYSGGAPGADTLFGTFAERCGIAEQNYSFRGHLECRTRGRVILTPDDLQMGDAALQEVMGDVFTKGLKRHPPARSLMYWRRNWHQVKNTTQIFAVLKDRTFLDFAKDQPDGAGVAIALAILAQPRCARVCVYLQVRYGQWLEWQRKPRRGGKRVILAYKKRVNGKTRRDGIEFSIQSPQAIKIASGDFTGIGTREVGGDGMKAIKELFERSFPGHF